MKKISTVVAKQGRNLSQPRLTIGLDLGDRNSCYCVLDETGQIQLEQHVRTNAKALCEVFGAVQGNHAIAVTLQEFGVYVGSCNRLDPLDEYIPDIAVHLFERAGGRLATINASWTLGDAGMLDLLQSHFSH
jgi:hypothetical protein